MSIWWWGALIFAVPSMRYALIDWFGTGTTDAEAKVWSRWNWLCAACIAMHYIAASGAPVHEIRGGW
jgi:hypothetical protein